MLLVFPDWLYSFSRLSSPSLLKFLIYLVMILNFSLFFSSNCNSATHFLLSTPFLISATVLPPISLSYSWPVLLFCVLPASPRLFYLCVWCLLSVRSVSGSCSSIPGLCFGHLPLLSSHHLPFLCLYLISSLLPRFFLARLQKRKQWNHQHSVPTHSCCWDMGFQGRPTH